MEDITITKREIIFSIAIVLILSAIGIGIYSAISNSSNKDLEKYYKALKIDSDSGAFEYAMETNAGNSLVYGNFNIIDPITNNELLESYGAYSITTERYTEHQETVYEYDEDGNMTGFHIEYHYSWDYYSRETVYAEKVQFLNKEFSLSQFPLPSGHTLKIDNNTIKTNNETSGNYIYNTGSSWWNYVGQLRHYYTVYPTQWEGTILAYLGDNNIQNINGKQKVDFWNNTISEVINNAEKGTQIGKTMFVVIWIILTVGAVIGFYALDNYWLEDNQKSKNYF